MKRIFVISLLAITFSMPALAETSTAELLKQCSESTKVYDRVDGDIKKVGEKLGEFCEGFLAASFEAQILEKNICSDGPGEPHYLKSVLETFVADNPNLKGAPASQNLKKALSNAFSCKKN